MKRLATTILLIMPLTSMAQDFANEIQARQQAFSAIETKLEQAEEKLDSNQKDWLSIKLIGAELMEHSQVLMSSFPEGSEEGSKAKPAIWDNPDKFQRLLKQMEQGFKALYKASTSLNKSDAEVGLEMASDTCRSCHRSYRSRW